MGRITGGMSDFSILKVVPYAIYRNFKFLLQKIKTENNKLMCAGIHLTCHKSKTKKHKMSLKHLNLFSIVLYITSEIHIYTYKKYMKANNQNNNRLSAGAIVAKTGFQQEEGLKAR